MRGAAVLLAVVLALIAPPALAVEQAARAVERAAERLAEAEAALARAGAATDRRAALTEALRAYEQGLAGMRAGLARAEARERAIARSLSDRSYEITQLLAAMQHLGRTPPPLRPIHPDGPLTAARAAGILSAVTPVLAAEAAALIEALDALERARGLQLQAEAAIGPAMAALTAAREAFEAELDPADGRPLPVASPAVQLARDAETLGAFASALSALQDAPPPAVTARLPEALPWPVTGHLIRAFGTPDQAGLRRPGVDLAAMPRSLVTAPADATIRFAGAYLDYGYVAILDVGADTLIVLAGLDRLFVQEGDRMRSGDLIGVLGGTAGDGSEFLVPPSQGSEARGWETLYIEVRKGNAAIDPEAVFERDRT